MTDTNEKLDAIKKKLSLEGVTTFDECSKPFKNTIVEGRRAAAESSKPMSISGYVELTKNTLSHFPTHIQIRILARAAMQVADEQKRSIDRLARGK